VKDKYAWKVHAGCTLVSLGPGKASSAAGERKRRSDGYTGQLAGPISGWIYLVVAEEGTTKQSEGIKEVEDSG